MFKDDHPHYRNYEETTLHTKTVPDKLSSALNGLIVRHCDGNASILKIVVNKMRSWVPTELSVNRGWDWLIYDLDDGIRQLKNGAFHKFMDALADVAQELGSDFVDELNEVLEELDFGYFIEFTPFSEKAEWVLREEQIPLNEQIQNTVVEIGDLCKQTSEHLRQCANNVTSDTPRVYKDAVRDAMSAMESLLRKITGTKDIKAATTEMKNEGNWGLTIIVKDGLSIWNRLHHEYPDIRHGNPDETDITKEEAVYWIERMLAFIKYISRRYHSM